ncbi:MAG: hypothetical protein OHK005_11970 [Candidatus Methylacidiphilales bacterium]
MSKPTFGVCLGLEHADALKSAGGVDFLEVNVQGFLRPMEEDKAFQENLELARNSPVPVYAANCFLPGSLKSAGPQADPDAVLGYAATAFARARACGIKMIVFGSGGSRHLPEGVDQEAAVSAFVNLLRRLGPLAGAEGVALVLEPLNADDCNFIFTVKEGAAIVRQVNHPAVRLLADLYHMSRNGEPVEDLADVMDILGHVHLAESAARTAPGVAGESFTEAFRMLRAGGYAGGISVEANWSDPVAEALRAMAVLRAQWEQA